jgi:hypothetical protein
MINNKESGYINENIIITILFEKLLIEIIFLSSILRENKTLTFLNILIY